MPQTQPTFVGFHGTTVWTLFFSGISWSVRHQAEVYSSPKTEQLSAAVGGPCSPSTEIIWNNSSQVVL
jgi:hypothetical protein